MKPTREPQGVLIRWLRSKDRDRRATAVAQLCAMYEPLIRAMAKRYRQAVLEAGREELEQVARLALVETCTSFDASRWKRRKDGLERLFARYAVWSVRHALDHYIRALPNPVRLPGVVMDKMPRLRREARRLANVLMREPTIEELTKAVGMPNGKYQQNSVAMVAALLAYEDGPCEAIENTIATASMTPEELLLAKEEYTALRRQRRIG